MTANDNHKLSDSGVCPESSSTQSNDKSTSKVSPSTGKQNKASAPPIDPQSEQTQKPQQEHLHPQLQQSMGQGYHGKKRWRGNRNRRNDILYEKAIKLAQSGRVEFLNTGLYNVVGDHGTYAVAVDHTGQLSCNCLGFLQKNRCSHTLAVYLITKKRRRY